MAYLKIVGQIDKKNTEKAEFYLKNNLFQTPYNARFLNDDLSIKILLKKAKKDIFALAQNINFLFVDDTNDWSFVSFPSDFGNNCVLINTSSATKAYIEGDIAKKFDGLKEVYDYLAIFATLSIYLNKNFFVNCFENFDNYTNLPRSANVFFILQEATNFFFENKEYRRKIYNFLSAPTDLDIQKILMLGKKYVFSLDILFFDEKINSKQASTLLDFDDETECELFLKNHTGVAKIAFLNHTKGLVECL